MYVFVYMHWSNNSQRETQWFTFFISYTSGVRTWRRECNNFFTDYNNKRKRYSRYVCIVIAKLFISENVCKLHALRVVCGKGSRATLKPEQRPPRAFITEVALSRTAGGAKLGGEGGREHAPRVCLLYTLPSPPRARFRSHGRDSCVCVCVGIITGAWSER